MTNEIDGLCDNRQVPLVRVNIAGSVDGFVEAIFRTD